MAIATLAQHGPQHGPQHSPSPNAAQPHCPQDVPWCDVARGAVAGGALSWPCERRQRGRGGGARELAASTAGPRALRSSDLLELAGRALDFFHTRACHTLPAPAGVPGQVDATQLARSEARPHALTTSCPSLPIRGAPTAYGWPLTRARGRAQAPLSAPASEGASLGRTTCHARKRGGGDPPTRVERGRLIRTNTAWRIQTRLHTVLSSYGLFQHPRWA